MSLLAKLNETAVSRGLGFLVIGEHAVIEHGFQRGTQDVDLLACKEDRSRWLDLAKSLGYRLFRDGGSFVQREKESGSRNAQSLDPLPNWDGQVRHPSRVPADQWRRYCRGNLEKLRSRPGYLERRRRNGIAEEFSFGSGS